MPKWHLIARKAKANSHHANAEDAKQADLVAGFDMQIEDHWQRQDKHEAVDDDIDNTDGGVASDAVAARSVDSGIPVLFDRTTDEEANQDCHDQPGGLHADNTPGDDLYR